MRFILKTWGIIIFSFSHISYYEKEANEDYEPPLLSFDTDFKSMQIDKTSRVFNHCPILSLK